MELIDAIKSRHAVRSYKDIPIKDNHVKILQEIIDSCNDEGNLRMQLIINEEDTFGRSKLAHYGNFKNVKNFIVLVGKKANDLSERCGYYGEKVVIAAQAIGLNTCWVAATYSRSQAKEYVMGGEKLLAVISIGYGAEQGKAHKSKSFEEVATVNGTNTEWFQAGVQAALLAPTTRNQQKFRFELKGETVTAKALFGPYCHLDLGIVKYHFEIGSGKKI